MSNINQEHEMTSQEQLTYWGNLSMCEKRLFIWSFTVDIICIFIGGYLVPQNELAGGILLGFALFFAAVFFGIHFNNNYKK
jgi:hypothetical protein